jgi:hypothetical protein
MLTGVVDEDSAVDCNGILFPPITKMLPRATQGHPNKTEGNPHNQNIQRQLQ